MSDFIGLRNSSITAFIVFLFCSPVGAKNYEVDHYLLNWQQLLKLSFQNRSSYLSDTEFSLRKFYDLENLEIKENKMKKESALLSIFILDVFAETKWDAISAKIQDIDKQMGWRRTELDRLQGLSSGVGMEGVFSRNPNAERIEQLNTKIKLLEQNKLELQMQLEQRGTQVERGIVEPRPLGTKRQRSEFSRITGGQVLRSNDSPWPNTVGFCGRYFSCEDPSKVACNPMIYGFLGTNHPQIVKDRALVRSNATDISKGFQIVQNRFPLGESGDHCNEIQNCDSLQSALSSHIKSADQIQIKYFTEFTKAGFLPFTRVTYRPEHGITLSRWLDVYRRPSGALLDRDQQKIVDDFENEKKRLTAQADACTSNNQANRKCVSKPYEKIHCVNRPDKEKKSTNELCGIEADKTSGLTVGKFSLARMHLDFDSEVNCPGYFNQIPGIKGQWTLLSQKIDSFCRGAMSSGDQRAKDACDLLRKRTSKELGQQALEKVGSPDEVRSYLQRTSR